MTRVLAYGGVRFVLAGALAVVLAACFVGRADAASVFSSSFAAPSMFAQPAVAGAKVVAGDRALTLSWDAVKGAAAYRVSWRGRVLKGGKPTAVWSSQWLGLKVLGASARSYKATGLVNAAEYQLRLESNTTAKKSLWLARSTPVGSPKAVTPPPTPPTTPATGPGAPTGVSGVVGDTSVVVSWSAPSSNGGSAVTGYTVRASGDSSQACATNGSLSCTVAGLANGTAYTFTVVATSAIGNSGASVASAAVTPATVPGAPPSVWGVDGDGQVTVSWSAPSSDGGSAVTGYTVSASNGGSHTCTTATLSCTVTGLTNATAYTFTVKATNARGNSSASAASAAVTPSVASCANGRAVCVVGDIGPGGGKVFYAPGGTFTETDAPCGSSCRYLEAAPADWNPPSSPDPRLKWGGGSGYPNANCSNRDIPGAASTSIGSGFANTAAIRVACPSTDPLNDESAPAAFAASTYRPTFNGVVVTGWFLPSLDELNALDISAVGGLLPYPDAYESSSQYPGSTWLYWIQIAGNGGEALNQRWANRNFVCSVRPVRAFN